MRTIGIGHKTRYWQHYCFSNPPEGYRYARMLDIPWHLGSIHWEPLANTKYFFPFRVPDIFHTYNGIVANAHPWVIEVESYLPRFQHMSVGHPLYRWAMGRLAGRHCKAIIFTSLNTLALNRAKLEAAGVDKDKFSVIYRAVERYAPMERKDAPFNILFAGNGFYRKGGLELLKAFKRLSGREARLLIVSSMQIDWGIFPNAEDVAWAARTIADDPRISIHNDMDHGQLIDHMRMADVFISSTKADPFNNTILEAMGTGLPVVTSDVGALPEVVQDGINGWTLRVAGRSSDEIAEETAMHIAQLMDDPALRARMGAASHAIVEARFSLPVRNAALTKLYEKALDGA